MHKDVHGVTHDTKRISIGLTEPKLLDSPSRSAMWYADAESDKIESFPGVLNMHIHVHSDVCRWFENTCKRVRNGELTSWRRRIAYG